MPTPLEIHERKIDPKYFRLNPEWEQRFLETCEALYTIIDHKLYKQRYKSAEKYFIERWNVKRSSGYNLYTCGRILKELQDAGYDNDQLPSGSTLCLEVDKCAKRQDIAPAEIWKKALKHYGNRDDVIACKLDELTEREREGGEEDETDNVSADSLAPKMSAMSYSALLDSASSTGTDRLRPRNKPADYAVESEAPGREPLPPDANRRGERVHVTQVQRANDGDDGAEGVGKGDEDDEANDGNDGGNGDNGEDSQDSDDSAEMEPDEENLSHKTLSARTISDPIRNSPLPRSDKISTSQQLRDRVSSPRKTSMERFSSEEFGISEAVSQLTQVPRPFLNERLNLIQEGCRQPEQTSFPLASRIEDGILESSKQRRFRASWDRFENCREHRIIVLFQSSVCAVALFRAYRDYVERAMENRRIKTRSGSPYVEWEDTPAFKRAIEKFVMRDLQLDTNDSFWQEVEAGERLSALVESVGEGILLLNGEDNGFHWLSNSEIRKVRGDAWQDFLRSLRKYSDDLSAFHCIRLPLRFREMLNITEEVSNDSETQTSRRMEQSPVTPSENRQMPSPPPSQSRASKKRTRSDQYEDKQDKDEGSDGNVAYGGRRTRFTKRKRESVTGESMDQNMHHRLESRRLPAEEQGCRNPWKAVTAGILEDDDIWLIDAGMSRLADPVMVADADADADIGLFHQQLLQLPTQRRRVVSEVNFETLESTEFNSACIFIVPERGRTIGWILDRDWTSSNIDKLVIFGRDLIDCGQELQKQYITADCFAENHIHHHRHVLVCRERRSFKLTKIVENRQVQYAGDESAFLAGKVLSREERKTPVQTITLDRIFSGEEVSEHVGCFFDLGTTKCFPYDTRRRGYDPLRPIHEWRVLNSNADVVDRLTGKTILKFRKARIPFELQKVAYDSLIQAAKFSRNANRGKASGILDEIRVRTVRPDLVVGKADKFRVYPQTPSGETSTTSLSNPAKSAIVGWIDIAERRAKHVKCRLTAYTAQHMKEYESSIPFFEYIDRIYRKEAPQEWKLQMDAARKTHARVGKTSFSSITVNYDWRSALHQDIGDFKEGYGILAVCQRHNCGGELLFPEYRVAVRITSGDLLLFDSHLYHCNAPLNNDGSTDRLSFVCYLRKNIESVCGNGRFV